jgi:hypothetical protein
MDRKRKKIVIISERDISVFDEFFILLAGGIGALGLEKLIPEGYRYGLLYLGISFLIIVAVCSWIRKKSDTQK